MAAALLAMGLVSCAMAAPAASAVSVNAVMAMERFMMS
jgi:hypothetical protein